jgi:hypothetical protein
MNGEIAEIRLIEWLNPSFHPTVTVIVISVLVLLGTTTQFRVYVIPVDPVAVSGTVAVPSIMVFQGVTLNRSSLS